MTNWRRILVGDAFQRPQRHPRFYADVALLFPLMVALLGVWTAFSWRPLRLADPVQFWWCAAFAAACLLLMKERLATLAAGFLFVAGQAGWRLSLAKGASTQRGTLEAAVIGAVMALALIVLITWRKRGAKLYGDPPTRFDWWLTGTLGALVVAGLAVILVRTALWYAAAYWH